MGYYENLRCGKCNYSFTDGYAPSNGFMKTSLGVPYLKCPKCNTVNKTNMTPYSVFHRVDKIYFWISQTIRFGLFFGIPISVGLINLFDLSITIGGCFGFSLGIGIGIIFGLLEIREVESEYKKNLLD